MELRPHQAEVIPRLKNGNILYGSVGSGKTWAAFGYYMANECPKDITVITTARKRDDLDWEKVGAQFMISPDVFMQEENYKQHRGILTVDSWNNIGNYTDIEGAFFVFDEQRLVGNGAWVKAFYKIAKKNNWIMLSGTPGDTWMDYAPVMIANGYFKNITDFKFKHVLYEPYVKFPKIKAYIGEAKLEQIRSEILVEMPYESHTTPIIEYVEVGYDQELARKVSKDRWNPYAEQPVLDAGEMFRLTKRIMYTDPSRLEAVRKLMAKHNRLIIFYQYNYELEELRTLATEVNVYEWNGHRKHPNSTFEDEEEWVYLVQYTSGAEAWNCTKTDATILYSMTYSYKLFKQAMGRIDRLDTPFSILYYYVLVSNLWLDQAVKGSLEEKKDFNERNHVVHQGFKPAG